jgi:hypothetical protein
MKRAFTPVLLIGLVILFMIGSNNDETVDASSEITS